MQRALIAGVLAGCAAGAAPISMSPAAQPQGAHPALAPESANQAEPIDAPGPLGPQPDQNAAQPDSVIVAGQVELARLVDLASGRLGLNIEYDEPSLKGTVTLRLGAAITDAELWALVNQLLASRGLTTIRGDGSLSVVKLAEAAGLAPVEQAPLQGATGPGFITVAIGARHRPARALADAVGLILSKPAGKAQHLPGTTLILVSDLAPRVEQALALLDRLDVPDAAVTIREVPVEHMGAAGLATLVGQVQAKADA